MWEIFAYHNSEALEGIFNAIAAIMASGTYLSAIAAVGFCGFVAAIPAIIYGNRVRHDPSNPQQGFGTAGFIMGWISVALSLVVIVVWVIVLVSGGFSVSTY